MNYRIIDDAIPLQMGYYLFDMLCKENIWNLSLLSDAQNKNEPLLPGSCLIEHGKSSNINRWVEGFLKSNFMHMMYNNNLNFKELDRILCNANYPKSVLNYHIDNHLPGFETIVLFVTPNLENLGCGILIDNEYIEYKFCRAVIFDSTINHTAVSPQTDIPLPRLSIGYMYKVSDDK